MTLSNCSTERRVGHLVEWRLCSIVEVADLHRLEQARAKAVADGGRETVVCVDWRQGEVLKPDVADALTATWHKTATFKRSAILLSKDRPTFSWHTTPEMQVALVHDVARALLRLGTKPNAEASPWLGPVTWPGSVRGLFEVFTRISGRSVRPFRMPALIWPALGMFDPELRGIPEMLHQWRASYTLDDSRFRAAFGFTATPIEQAASEILGSTGYCRSARSRVKGVAEVDLRATCPARTQCDPSRRRPAFS